MNNINNHLDKFLNYICCPSCYGDLNINQHSYLKCKQCSSTYKVHSNKILKLFTPSNIYPTKEKINWETFS